MTRIGCPHPVSINIKCQPVFCRCPPLHAKVPSIDADEMKLKSHPRLQDFRKTELHNWKER